MKKLASQHALPTFEHSGSHSMVKKIMFYTDSVKKYYLLMINVLFFPRTIKTGTETQGIRYIDFYTKVNSPQLLFLNIVT